MLDINLLRKDLAAVAARLRTRGYDFDVAASTRSKPSARHADRTEELQARRNALSKQIGRLKAKGEDASALMAEVGRRFRDASEEARGAACRHPAEAAAMLMDVPNLPHESVPVGKSEAETTSRCAAGATPRKFDFPVKDHVDIGDAAGSRLRRRGQARRARASQCCAAPLARLHRALAQFMLDMQTREHGYTECYTPYIVNADTLIGTAQLPKFEHDMFAVTKGGERRRGRELYLISDVGNLAHQHWCATRLLD